MSGTQRSVHVCVARWLTWSSSVSVSVSVRGVTRAIALVKQSELLKIEDVLKFFPDFVVIDEFKTEITESLNQCSSRITDLKEEMKEYTESADRIRDDIKALRNRCVAAHAHRTCHHLP